MLRQFPRFLIWACALLVLGGVTVLGAFVLNRWAQRSAANRLVEEVLLSTRSDEVADYERRSQARRRFERQAVVSQNPLVASILLEHLKESPPSLEATRAWKDPWSRTLVKLGSLAREAMKQEFGRLAEVETYPGGSLARNADWFWFLAAALGRLDEEFGVDAAVMLASLASIPPDHREAAFEQVVRIAKRNPSSFCSATRAAACDLARSILRQRSKHRASDALKASDAVRVLGVWGDQRDIELLHALASEEDMWVLVEVVRAFGNLGVESTVRRSVLQRAWEISSREDHDGRHGFSFRERLAEMMPELRVEWQDLVSLGSSWISSCETDSLREVLRSALSSVCGTDMGDDVSDWRRYVAERSGWSEAAVWEESAGVSLNEGRTVAGDRLFVSRATYRGVRCEAIASWSREVLRRSLRESLLDGEVHDESELHSALLYLMRCFGDDANSEIAALVRSDRLCLTKCVVEAWEETESAWGVDDPGGLGIVLSNWRPNPRSVPDWCGVRIVEVLLRAGIVEAIPASIDWLEGEAAAEAFDLPSYRLLRDHLQMATLQEFPTVAEWRTWWFAGGQRLSRETCRRWYEMSSPGGI